MKDLLKALLVIICLGLLLYAAYLFYEKFFNAPEDEDDLDDLYDFEEEEPEISFAERVKAAAERQLERIR